jgi:circadian clock protein KaiC
MRTSTRTPSSRRSATQHNGAGTRVRTAPTLRKAATGIVGLDQLTGGGLPAGRTTLVCGGPGCGKTLLGLQFLANGATRLGEPGACLSFEESAEELTQNVASIGFDLETLVGDGKLAVDHVEVDRDALRETGAFDLEGLFIRLDLAVRSVGAKRVLLDSLEALFAGVHDERVLRGELRRLFVWLKDRGLTTVVTAERGDSSLTRHGLEEYISDCVIVLEHRAVEQRSTRRIRVVKYRGSAHGTNEYPFLIDDHGVSVVPVTSLGLDYPVSTERISSGVPRLDEMLGGRGYYRGSSVLISGGAGTGKSSVAAHLVDETCKRGQRALYVALEEPPQQIVRNMRSIGIDLEPWITVGLLRFCAARPTTAGLEMHLAKVQRDVEQFEPAVVVVDPISALVAVADPREVKVMLTRLFDFLKMRGITNFHIALTTGNTEQDSELGVSSLIDTWLQLREIEHAGERNRTVYLIKSRGMSHSNQVREFLITNEGVRLVDVYIGPQGVLVGSAREAQAVLDATATSDRKREEDRSRRALERRTKAVEAQIAALRAELGAEQDDLASKISETHQHAARAAESRAAQQRERTLGVWADDAGRARKADRRRS